MNWAGIKASIKDQTPHDKHLSQDGEGQGDTGLLGSICVCMPSSALGEEFNAWMQRADCTVRLILFLVVS